MLENTKSNQFLTSLITKTLSFHCLTRMPVIASLLVSLLLPTVKPTLLKPKSYHVTLCLALFQFLAVTNKALHNLVPRCLSNHTTSSLVLLYCSHSDLCDVLLTHCMRPPSGPLYFLIHLMGMLFHQTPSCSCVHLIVNLKRGSSGSPKPCHLSSSVFFFFFL